MEFFLHCGRNHCITKSKCPTKANSANIGNLFRSSKRIGGFTEEQLFTFVQQFHIHFSEATSFNEKNPRLYSKTCGFVRGTKKLKITTTENSWKTLSSTKLSHVQQFLSSTRILHFVLFLCAQKQLSVLHKGSIYSRPTIHSFLHLHHKSGSFFQHLERFPVLSFFFGSFLSPFSNHFTASLELVSQFVTVETEFKIC